MSKYPGSRGTDRFERSANIFKQLLPQASPFNCSNHILHQYRTAKFLVAKNAVSLHSFGKLLVQLNSKETSWCKNNMYGKGQKAFFSSFGSIFSVFQDTVISSNITQQKNEQALCGDNNISSGLCYTQLPCNHSCHSIMLFF